VLYCIGDDSSERDFIRMMQSTNSIFSCDLTSEISNELVANKHDTSKTNSITPSFAIGNSLTLRFVNGVDQFLVIDSLSIKAYQNT
jgi:hypothetical protein